MSKPLVLAALAALSVLPVRAETQKKAPATAQAEAAQKTADIKRWLAFSGVVAMQVDAAKRTLPATKARSNKDIPEAFWADFEKAITYEAYEAAMVEVYEKSFSAAELREFVKLIDSPTFKKFHEKDKKVQAELVGDALKRVMESNSKRLMQKHNPKGAAAPKKS
jgi:F420-dependent methylenetetrahydromethanopterin dehydrogenase